MKDDIEGQKRKKKTTIGLHAHNDWVKRQSDSESC